MFKSNLFRQVYRFVIVGVINTAVDLVVLNVLIALTHQGKEGFYYSVFKTISFLVAVTNSYLMNKYWTFVGDSSPSKKTAVEMAQFLVVSIIGLIINVGAASLFVNHTSALAGLENYWPSIGALCGTAVGLVWNFLGYKIVVFNKNQKSL